MTLPGIIVDGSNNNGDPSSWDFNAMRNAGVIAVAWKATEGTNFIDKYFGIARAKSRAAGLGFVGYHFSHFTDPAAEARYFLAVAGADGKILDSETNTNAAWQNAFLAALNLNPSQEMDYGSASTLPRSGIRGLLWPAAYGQSNPPGFGSEWQFTDARVVPGCPVPLDASVWTGDQASFNTFFGTAVVGAATLNLASTNFPKAIDAAATSSGLGDWVVGTDGGVFTVGDAQYYGSLPGDKIVTNNIVRIYRSWGGNGYYLLGSDGGVFAFGDAKVATSPCASYPGLPAAERQGSRTFGAFVLDWGGSGYTEIALDGSRYHFTGA